MVKLFNHVKSLPLPPITKRTLNTLVFGTFQTDQFDFQLIPFRKQINNEGPICGFHPLMIKTSQPGCVFFYQGRTFKIENFF